MIRYGFVFLSGVLFTLMTSAFFRSPEVYPLSPVYQFATLSDQYDLSSYFAGGVWLENQLLSKRVDLNGVFQKKAFVKKLSNKSEVRRYNKSYSTWIEERKCLESPYIDKPMKSNMTSLYGYRKHPFTGHKHIHAGVDFRGKIGTSVLAGSAGVVKRASRKGNYGKTIIVDHGNGFSTLYGHLSGYAVKEGQWVTMGQTIGFVGKSGRATGPHLHFEVRCHNVPLNPLQYLGKMGRIAEVKFKKKRRSYLTSGRGRAPAKSAQNDPNHFTRMINLEKLKKLQDSAEIIY
jgi:hypothetical protein